MRPALFVAVGLNVVWSGLLTLWYLLVGALAGTPTVLLDDEQSAQRTRDMLAPQPLLLVPSLVLLVLLVALFIAFCASRGRAIATRWPAVTWYITTAVCRLVLVSINPTRRTGVAELRSTAFFAAFACLLQVAGLVVLTVGIARTRRRPALLGDH